MVRYIVPPTFFLLAGARDNKWKIRTISRGQVCILQYLHHMKQLGTQIIYNFSTRTFQKVVHFSSNG